MYVACFFCLTLPLRKNLLGSKRKAINIISARDNCRDIVVVLEILLVSARDNGRAVVVVLDILLLLRTFSLPKHNLKTMATMGLKLGTYVLPRPRMCLLVTLTTVDKGSKYGLKSETL